MLRLNEFTATIPPESPTSMLAKPSALSSWSALPSTLVANSRLVVFNRIVMTATIVMAPKSLACSISKSHLTSP